MFELEKFKRFYEERRDDGAHEEGGGAAEETGDRHDLDRCVGVEIRRPCVYIHMWREEMREI